MFTRFCQPYGRKGTTFKNVPNNSIQAMKFPEAPHSLKMACGEIQKESMEVVVNPHQPEWVILAGY